MSQQPPPPEQPAKEKEPATSEALRKWEYKVIHININTTINSSKPATPETDSQKLQGVLSPEYIKREFPQMYQANTNPKKHPAAQLEQFLNQLGNEGWELIETNNVGGLLMFFFKRLTVPKPASKSDQ